MRPTDARRELPRPARTPLAGLAAAIAAMTGCATIDPVGTGANTLPREAPASDRIAWPPQYEPEKATFFVHNEIEIDAPPERVWALLVDAERWPAWYEGAGDVELVGSDARALTAGSSFTWRTMGFRFTSVVHEFDPPYRLAWESRRDDIKGYHAWLIIPEGAGSRVITDESQFGLLANLQRVFQPNKLRKLHDRWLEELKRRAESPEG